jgi:hypothetical protein
MRVFAFSVVMECARIDIIQYSPQHGYVALSP